MTKEEAEERAAHAYCTDNVIRCQDWPAGR